MVLRVAIREEPGQGRLLRDDTEIVTHPHHTHTNVVADHDAEHGKQRSLPLPARQRMGCGGLRRQLAAASCGGSRAGDAARAAMHRAVARFTAA